MSKTELNVHQLIRNQAIRHKLSFHEMTPMHKIDSIKRSSKPIYKTLYAVAVAYKDKIDETIDTDDFAIWLGEPIQEQ